MKKLAYIIAAALAMTACGNNNRNSGNVVPEENMTDVIKEEQQITGGYTEQREPTDEEYQLFRKVTDTIDGMTFTPLTVQTQVVAGINYRFYCRFSDGSEEYSPGHCWLTIFKPLPGRGEPEVTSMERVTPAKSE